MHLDNNAGLLSTAQVKVEFCITVGINLVVENKDCKHCDMKLVNWFEHGQVCSRKLIREEEAFPAVVDILLLLRVYMLLLL